MKYRSSGLVGVFWEKQCSKWRAQIMHEGERIHLGLFDSPTEAARARDEAAKKLHGEFAVLNLPVPTS